MIDNQKNIETKELQVEFEGAIGEGESKAFNNQKVIDATKKEINDLKKEVTEFKIKTIEILAIFVALFTFVSVDIQIFKSEISFLSATGTSLITLGALLFFISILHLLLDYSQNYLKQNKNIFISIVVISVILIAVGIYFIFTDYRIYTKKIKNDFYLKNDVDQKLTATESEIKQSQENFNDFKNCLKNGGWNKCF